MYALIDDSKKNFKQNEGKEKVPIHLDLNTSELDGITRSALWDKSDFNYHIKYISKINNASSKSQRSELINNLVGHFDSLYNDHRNHILEPYKAPHKHFESFGTSKNHNKTTIYACMRHAEIICEESIERFYWIASGTSVSATPLIIDKKLNAENMRVSLKDNGFLFSNSNVIMEHGVFPTLTPDATIKEFGAFDNPSQLALLQTCEWHNIIKYSNEYHEHKQNETYYTATHAMELRPSNKD